MAKNKKINIDLDSLDVKKGVVARDDILKLKDAKFGSKLPSLLARGMADLMFKSPDTGAYIESSGMDDDRKEAIIKTLKKDFTKIAKSTNRNEIRIRVVDQGNRVVFFYDKKGEKVGAKKKK